MTAINVTPTAPGSIEEVKALVIHAIDALSSYASEMGRHAQAADEARERARLEGLKLQEVLAQVREAEAKLASVEADYNSWTNKLKAVQVAYDEFRKLAK